MYSRMDQAMQDVDVFEDVMHWMHREFCAESMLCFIELVQWKQAMAHLVDPTDESMRCKYVLNESVPRSSIVQAALVNKSEAHHGESKVLLPGSSPAVESEQDTLAAMMRMRSAAQLLYDKYIVVGAELEVNISGMLRDQFREVQRTYWNINGLELVKVFDPLLLAMRQQITNSFVRFENAM